MDEMNKEELLSAFLDGEVTAEQRAYVEKLIETDAEARAALEELRAMSDSLKGLPRMEVGEDLSERVLRRAERAILERQPEETIAPAAAATPATESADNSSTSETVAMKSDDTVVQPSPSAGASSGIGWGRRLAGPLAAIAAALLIMVMSQDKQEGDLAQAPNGGVSTAPDTSYSDSEESEESFRADSNHAFKSGGNAANGTSANRTPGEPGAPSMSAMRSPAMESKQGYVLDRAAAPTKNADIEGTTDKLAKSEITRGKRDDLRTQSQGRAAQKDEAGQPLVGGRNRSEGVQMPTDGTDARLARSRRGARGITGKKGGNLLDDEANDLAPEPQLVVNIVVSSTARQSKSFDQLLARQNIHFDLPPDDIDRLADASPPMRKNQQPEFDQKPLQEVPEERAVEMAQSKSGENLGENLKEAQADKDSKRQLEEDSVLAGAAGKNQPVDNKFGSAADESVELVYVVASAAQVQAALQEMQQQSQDYLAYSIEPQPTTLGDYAPGDRAAEGGGVQTVTEPAERNFGQQQAVVADTKKSNQPRAEKKLQNGPTVVEKNSTNSRPSRTADADSLLPAKPGAGAKPAPALPQSPASSVRGQSENEAGESAASQSTDTTAGNQRLIQLPAGRAQRVQIPVDQLSRWRESSGWYFVPGEEAQLGREQFATEMAKQSKEGNFRDRQAGGGAAPAGEQTQSVTSDLAEAEPKRDQSPSATPSAPQVSAKETKEQALKQKPAPGSQAAPAQAPAPSAAEPPTLTEPGKNAQSQNQTAQQGEKSAPVQLDPSEVYWEAEELLNSGQGQDQVRVLFVVRGASLGQPNGSQDQSGAKAAAEAERAAPGDSLPSNNGAPQKNSPQPNASPADEE